jgi:hypothetical protein
VVKLQKPNSTWNGQNLSFNGLPVELQEVW